MGIEDLSKELDKIKVELNSLLTALKSGEVEGTLDGVISKLERVSDLETRIGEIAKGNSKAAKEAAKMQADLAKEKLTTEQVYNNIISSRYKESVKDNKNSIGRLKLEKELVKTAMANLKIHKKGTDEYRASGAVVSDFAASKAKMVLGAGKAVMGAMRMSKDEAAQGLSSGGDKVLEKGMATTAAALMGFGGTVGIVLGPVAIALGAAMKVASINLKMMASRLEGGSAAIAAMSTGDARRTGELYESWVYKAASAHMMEAGAVKEMVGTLGTKYKFSIENFVNSTNDSAASAVGLRRTAVGLGISEQQATSMLDTLASTYRTSTKSAKSVQDGMQSLNKITGYSLRADKAGIMNKAEYATQLGQVIESTNDYITSVDGAASLLDHFSRIGGKNAIAQNKLHAMTSQAVTSMRGVSDSLKLIASPGEGLAALWNWETQDADVLQKKMTGMFGGAFKINEGMSDQEKGLKLMMGSGVTGMDRGLQRRLFYESQSPGRMAAAETASAIDETRRSVDAIKDLYGPIEKMRKGIESISKNIDTSLSNMVQRLQY